MTGPAEFELRHDLLRAVDRALGAEAEAARLAGEVAAFTAKLEARDAALRSARQEATSARAERDRLAARMRAMRASTTWRVGHALVAPASRLARRVRR